jgi:tetratricopeptide (TPR) repeat protein
MIGIVETLLRFKGLICQLVLTLLVLSLVRTLVFSPPLGTIGARVADAEILKTREGEAQEFIRQWELIRRRGVALFREGQYHRAVQAFQRALSINAEDSTLESMLHNSQQAIRQKEAEERQKAREAAARLEAERIFEELMARADALISSKQYQQALELLEGYQGLKSHGELVESKLVHISRLIEAQNTPSQEPKTNKKRPTLSKRKTTSLYEKAKSHHLEGRYLEAIKVLLIIQQDGASGHEKQNAGVLIPKIEEQLNELLDRSYQRAASYFKANDYINALISSERVIANSTSDFRGISELAHNCAQQLYRMGIVYESIGNYEKAYKFWHSILEHYPYKKDRYYTRTLKKMEGMHIND